MERVGGTRILRGRDRPGRRRATMAHDWSTSQWDVPWGCTPMQQPAARVWAPRGGGGDEGRTDGKVTAAKR